MLAEIRIESLGAIKTASAEFDRGLTVLTGETGAGKTMVVTGLHLLGGARADAHRVRNGSDRAVVEGRFTTAELSADGGRAVDEILESSGSDRDDDGSVIASRSVSRDGPSRAYLGGRSVPAKSLSSFTGHLLALHGQNDQLRLMRPDEQRVALDRFADVDVRVERYQKLREEWRQARRDLVDRTAARPPTPESTSSNTIVVPADEAARTTSSASITRESSPPDALLCSGSTAPSRCAVKPNSMRSTPCEPACTTFPPGRVSGAESPD